MGHDSWKLQTPPEYDECELSEDNEVSVCEFCRLQSSETCCPWCEKEFRAWIVPLAHNLAVAAGLCRAFTIGGAVALDSAMGIGLYQWRPGCGRHAP
jgi:hypothetical protein